MTMIVAIAGDDGLPSVPGTSTAKPYASHFAARLLMLDALGASDDETATPTTPTRYIVEQAGRLIAVARAADLQAVVVHLERARLAAMKPARRSRKKPDR